MSIYLCVCGLLATAFQFSPILSSVVSTVYSQGCLAEQRAMAVSHVAGRVFTLAGHVTGQLPGRMGWVGALDIHQHRRKKKHIVYRVPRAPIGLSIL